MGHDQFRFLSSPLRAMILPMKCVEMDGMPRENQINITQVQSIVAGTSFIDISDVYCFRTGLLISVYKDVYQYRHFR